MATEVWNPPEVSKAARALGAHAGTDRQCAKAFIENCLPKSWRPRVILPDIWEWFPGSKIGTIQYGFQLENFVYKREKQGDWKAIRNRWFSLGKSLCGGLRAIKGVRVIEEGSGTMTHCQPHLWTWRFRIENGRFEGVYSIWITPRGGKKALLIASFMEFPG